ncbi:signal transduction histidine kinase [Homoserinimonas aerilata]|uniref:Signal transduction histidine kinase n=1 Tax=Homoserinimonas aerilata TaxID=1162970 RepID=A0A542YHR8_9MICO|nr:sensor histidine kinase [Homoserinimonas aerilata]TQL47622.1 signal transduction histidine kinase [Homoserinimonas aerilata]
MNETERDAGRSALAHAPLAPVFLALRISLHTLMVLLAGFVIVRAVIASGATASWIVGLAVVLIVSYACGAFIVRGADVTVQRGWLALVTIEVMALTALTADAAFLIFPLFFLQLHLLPRRWGAPIVLLTTAITIAVMTMHSGVHLGGVLGPLIGAAVAIVMALGYQALYTEARQRQLLIDELLAAREELAREQHNAGVAQERARLAREIHDTVAQGLSSIQLLLHAAERDSSGEVLEQLRLARETAAEGLAEARRFIRELSPPALEGQSLGAALARLCDTSSGASLTVTFHESGDPAPMPMQLETALLRIAQGALANVTQHSHAHRAEVTLSHLDDWVGLDIVDDGVGFDPPQAHTDAPPSASFGLTAIRQRVEQLGGSLSIESDAGGTAIAVGFSLEGTER